MEKRILSEDEIVKIDKFVLEDSPYAYINMGVWVVMKCNFNDEMLVKSEYLSVSELKDKPLVWVDLYLGKCKICTKKIAFVKLLGEELSVIVDDGENKILYKLKSYDFFVDDNDVHTLISSKISLHKNKESWW